MPGLSEGDRALMRSQSGSGAGVAFSTTPCTPLTRLEPQLFRVLLLRRLRLPLPFVPLLAFVGGRVTTNIFVRDLDITAPNAMDNRRLEVVADGLPLFGGAQLAVDTTMVSPLRGDGSPHRGAAERDGVVLVAARRRKERTYPELMAPRSRARLVVLAMEVGGKRSPEALTFIRLLAKAKTRHEPNLMRKRVEQAWRMRWCSLLGCAARALAMSLLELRGG